MASASILLPEDCFLCSICLDAFTDPISTPCGHNYCKACIARHWDATDDASSSSKCPLCNRTFHKGLEFSVNKVFSEMTEQFRGHKLREYEAKTEAEVQQMIEERQLKIQEVKRSAELGKEDAETVVAASVQVFSALISCIERSQAELIDAIEERQKANEKQAEGFVRDLQNEIAELRKRSAELKKFSGTGTDGGQKFLPIASSAWRPTKDWTRINVHQPSHVRTVRTTASRLERTLGEQMEKMYESELRRVQEYLVDVTLDADTAHCGLVLSDDGKQVSHGNTWKDLPDGGGRPRFSEDVNVLGREGFSAGRFYYEVKVKGKTEWSLGVARESIDRKGHITLSPDDGYWTIVLRNANEYRAAAGPAVLLAVREEVQKVGVFVDYEEGVVSFYDEETKVHLYSYAGCAFAGEKLFPFFSPCLNDGGRNSAPLVICPVSHVVD